MRLRMLIKNPIAITMVPIHTKLIIGNMIDLITIQSVFNVASVTVNTNLFCSGKIPKKVT